MKSAHRRGRRNGFMVFYKFHLLAAILFCLSVSYIYILTGVSLTHLTRLRETLNTTTAAEPRERESVCVRVYKS